MPNLYKYPSFYAHIFNGLILFVILIIILKNHQIFLNLEPYNFVLLLLLLSISIGIHGLSHMGLEQYYNYNPLINVNKLLNK